MCMQMFDMCALVLENVSISTPWGKWGSKDIFTLENVLSSQSKEVIGDGEEKLN